jgi:hypothetical protein
MLARIFWIGSTNGSAIFMVQCTQRIFTDSTIQWLGFKSEMMVRNDGSLVVSNCPDNSTFR